MFKQLTMALFIATFVSASELLIPGGAAGIFAPGENVELMLKTTKPIMLEVFDYYGKSILKMNASPGKITLPDRKWNGYYTVKAGNLDTSFLVNESPAKRDPFFAIRPFDWYDPSTFVAIKKLGFGAIQFNIGGISTWGQERFDQGDIKEHIRNSPYTTRVRKLMEQDEFTFYGQIGLDGFFKNGPIPRKLQERKARGYYCYSDEIYDRYASMIEVFQEISGGKIKYWTLGSEVDTAIHDSGRFTEGGAVELAHHVTAARIAGTLLRKLDPKAKIIIMSSCGRDYHLTRPQFLITKFVLRDLGRLWDIIGLDAYNGNYSLRDGRTDITPPEDGLRAHILAARDLSREFGRDGTVTVDERSFHLPPSGTGLLSPTSRLLADYTARENIIIRSVRSVPHYIYLDYAWKSDQILWRNQFDASGKIIRAPFPAAMAYGTTIRMLSHSTPARRPEIRLPHRVFAYLFQKDGKSITPIWHAEKRADKLKLELILPADVEAVDINGRSSTIPAGKTVLELTSSPLFLVSPAAPEAMCSAITAGKLSGLKKVDAELRAGTPGTGLLFMINRMNEPRKVEFSGRSFELKPNERTVKSVPLTPDMRFTDRDESRTLATPAPALVIPKAGKELMLTSPRDVYPRSATIPERALLLGDGKDIEVMLHLGWNEKELIINAKVRDRAHINRFLADKLWMGDSMQIGFVPGNLAWNADMDKNIATIPFNASAALTEHGVKIYDHIRQKSADWPCTITRNGIYTDYRLGIPWSALGVAKARPGYPFAFNAVFFDLNKPTDRAEHYAALSEGLAGGVNPAQFKSFILGE